MRSTTLELEIIACSVEDAVAAYEGGASRLEVTVELARSGLTPPLELVSDILHRVPIPVRIMVRERDDFVLEGAQEWEMVKEHAHGFASLHVDGLVAGYIRDGSLDLDALQELTGSLPSMHFTIHNAIERTADPLQALRALRSFANVDRALVHGGNRSLEDRVRLFREYQHALGPGRSLIIGGGLTLDMLKALRLETNLRIFHLGRAVRTPERPTGKVDAEKVRRARELLIG